MNKLSLKTYRIHAIEYCYYMKSKNNNFFAVFYYFSVNFCSWIITKIWIFSRPFSTTPRSFYSQPIDLQFFEEVIYRYCCNSNEFQTLLTKATLKKNHYFFAAIKPKNSIFDYNYPKIFFLLWGKRVKVPPCKIT